MKKNSYKALSFLPSILIFIFFIFIFVYQDDVKNVISFSISLWKDNLFPSMYPFLLLSDLLINYDFVDLLASLMGNIIKKVFNVPKESCYAIIISMLSGFPSGAKYVNDLLTSSKINVSDANYLIMFTHFPNPLFVVSFVGNYILSNKKLGYVIFFSIVISNFIIALIFRPKTNNHENCLNLNVKTPCKKDFVKSFLSSSLKSFKILVNMLGIVMFSLILTTVLFNLFSFNIYIKVFLSSLIEMTNGIYFLSSINMDIVLKCALLSLIISFSGISVHMQVKSVILDSGIKYKNFLLSRIIGSILSFFIVLFFLSF